MGKLAERYRDAARSGLYAVHESAIPRAAAVEADVLLVEVVADRLAADWARIEQAILAEEAPAACVLLVPGAGELARPEHRGVLDRLAGMASSRRGAGRPLFVVMVDPEGRLGLPPLYREKPGK